MALIIENLNAGYRGRSHVLNDVSLCVAPGEIAAVIGPNGCGKSTLLRCISGLLKPESGRILLGDKELSALPLRERAQKLALLAQSFEGDQSLSVEETVLLGRTPFLPAYGTPTHSDREMATKAMQQTNVAGMRHRKLGELSGGEKQRVLLARALTQQPQVLLLDEPTSNLDIRYQYEILDLVFKLARREKLAVVLVLHQINLAAAVADTILLLGEDGHSHGCGSPEDVMTREKLEAVYRVPLEIFSHPKSGRPQARADWSFGG